MKKILFLSIFWCIMGIGIFVYVSYTLNKAESIPMENRSYTTAVIICNENNITEFKFKDTANKEYIGSFQGIDNFQLPLYSKVVVVYDINNPQINYINIPNLYYGKNLAIYILALICFVSGVGAVAAYLINRKLYGDMVKNDKALAIAEDIYGMKSINIFTVFVIISAAVVFAIIMEIYLYGMDMELVLFGILYLIACSSFIIIKKLLGKNDANKDETGNKNKTGEF